MSETRDKLLDAGFDLFAELGFDGASTRDICRRAEANPAALNYHYGSKEQLWLAACERASQWFLTQIAGAFPPGVAPHHALEPVFTAIFDGLVQDNRPIRIVMWASLHSDSLDYAVAASHFRPVVDLAIPALEALQFQGELDPEVDVAVVVPLLYGQVVHAFMDQAAHRNYYGLDFRDPDHADRFKKNILRSARLLLGIRDA